MTTDSAVLRLGAQYVLEGWVQGMRRDYDGRVCALGALDKAVWGLGLRRDPYNFIDCSHDTPVAVAALADLLPEPTWRAGCRIASWNNEPGRTAREVADMMLRAADLLDRVEQTKRAAVVKGPELVCV